MKIPMKLDSMPDRGGKPSVRELLSLVDFNPLKGTIDLSGARIVMQRANVGHIMREELRSLLGEEATRVFLLRQGYLTGRADARFVQEMWPMLSIGDAFTAGTRLHTFTGTVRVETVHNDFDFKRGRFSGEFIWHTSVEAEQIAQNGLRTSEPCCWTLVGYASGYATAFFGKPILYKEISCIAQGKDHCRVIGKPLEDWKPDDPAVIRFKEQIIPREPTRPAAHPKASRAVTGANPISAPIEEALRLCFDAGQPCIVSGPDDSGRRRALCAVVCPQTAEPEWLDGATLTVGALDEFRKTSKQPVLIDRIEQCSRAVQHRLSQGRAPFHGLTTASPKQLRSDRRIETAFFSVIAVGIVVMPAFQDRTEIERRNVVGWLSQEVATRFRTQVPDAETIAALAATDRLIGLSQVTGVLKRLALSQGDLQSAISAFARPVQDSTSDPRLEGWISDTLSAGVLDVNALERKVRSTAFDLEDGNLAAAARRLGLTRAQLAYRMKADAD
ncbi:XylR N-terminal domain-containing protein [Puniceibacterium confluentis]|uniref:XylR N-terminal domain-containing protein n=1 Tax=Puniceibacterium confluentis TaxID=1958944 RepID=UPI003565F2AB